MLRLREKVTNVLGRSGALGAYLTWQRLLCIPRVTVVTYHRVTDEPAGDMDDGVIDASVAEFDQHVTLLKQHFHVVSLDALLAAEVDGRPLPLPCALITFDDGYRDSFDIALPILEKHRVPATFFISTQHIEERKLFWWDVISFIVKRSTRSSLALRYPAEMALDLGHGREEARRRLLRIVKSHFALDVDRFVEELAVAAGVSLGDRALTDRAEALLMTWDQIRSLREAGMRVESHTRTHRVLQTLPDEELERELRGSREELEARIGRTVEAVAFPVGYSIRGDERLRARVRSAGYKMAFSNRSGTNALWRMDPLDVSRVSTERGMTPTQFLALVTAPQLMG